MDATPEAKVGEPISVTLTPEAAPDTENQADLGILLVHGIGEQAQGETLLQFAEPIIDWIRLWLRIDTFHPNASKDNRIHASPTIAKLRPPLLDTNTPAHTGVFFYTKDGDKEQGEEWLFAEAWWGQQVYPPSIASFTVWLLTRGPWLMLFHFNQIWLCDQKPKWQKVVMGIAATIIWLPLSMLVNFLLLAASLVALIPIGKVRNVVYSVLRAITGVLGDAYVQIRSPIQSVAFEDAVLKDLLWLSRRCKRLAIVAHSQGAAIAVGTLQREHVPKVDRLITVGAGIVKLGALRYFEKQDATSRVSAMLAPPFILLAFFVLVRARQMGLADASPAIFGPIFLGLLGAYFLANTWGIVIDALSDIRGREGGVAQPWCDIVATHDPVPAGNLTQFFKKIKGIEAKSLSVFNSFFNDHTGYWKARATFLPEIVSQLGKTSASKMLKLEEKDERLHKANEDYKNDLRVLSLSMLSDIFAFLAIPLLAGHNRLLCSVEKIREYLATGNGSSREAAPFAFIDDFISHFENGLRWLFNDAPELPWAPWAHVAVNSFLGLIVLAFLLWLWRKIAFALWDAWAVNRIEKAFRYGAMSVDSNSNSAQDIKSKIIQFFVDSIFHLGYLFILLSPFMASYIWLLFPSRLDESFIYKVFGWVGSILFACFMVGGLLADNVEKVSEIRGWLSKVLRDGALTGWPLARDLIYKILGCIVALIIAWIILGAFKLLPARINYADYLAIIINVVIYLGLLIYIINCIWSRLSKVKQRTVWIWGLLILSTAISCMSVAWFWKEGEVLGLVVMFWWTILFVHGIALLLLKWKQRKRKQIQ
jgi:hypothetical protein